MLLACTTGTDVPTNSLELAWLLESPTGIYDVYVDDIAFAR
jgi:hypothetical protein